MERMTFRCSEDGPVLLAGHLEEKYTVDQLVEVLLCKLAEYEDTGYSPNDITALAGTLEKFSGIMKELQIEIAHIREAAKLISNSCRPTRNDSGPHIDVPYPLGTKFYVIMYGYIEEQVLVGYKYRHGNLRLISDCGENWVIGVDAWLTWDEANNKLKGGGAG